MPKHTALQGKLRRRGRALTAWVGVLAAAAAAGLGAKGLGAAPEGRAAPGAAPKGRAAPGAAPKGRAAPGAAPAAKAPRVPARSRQLKALVDRYIEGLFRAKPHLATFMGDHRFDGALPDFSDEALFRRQNELEAVKAGLGRLDLTQLGIDDRIDAEILRDGIALELLYLREIRDWTWDPRLHDSFPYYDPREIVAGRLSDIIHGDFAPEAARRKSVVAQLKALPRMLAQIKAGLVQPARIYVEHAINGNAGRIGFFEKEVAPFVTRGGDKAAQAALALAIAALKDYQSFLKDDLLKRAAGDWRLGADRYKKKFPLALQTSFTPEQLLPRAEAAFHSARLELYQLARKLHGQLWPGQMVPAAPDAAAQGRLINKVRRELSKTHPEAATLVQSHARNLERMRAFIQKHDLIELPPAETLRVLPMPAFKRGAAGAEYLAPGILETGPSDKRGQKKQPAWQATYYVDPVDPSWPPDKVESYLRGQNDFQVELTAIHEAYPGHHTHFYYMRRAQNRLRSVLWNAPLAEGWAVYGEKQMVELGYGGDKNDRYRFFQLQGLMVVATNTLIDIKLHTGRMSDEEAVRFMEVEGFQERAVAEKKLVRAKLDSTQLVQYFLGLEEIEQLERDYRQKVGAAFKQREFNEALLRPGSVAVKFLRWKLLGAQPGATTAGGAAPVTVGEEQLIVDRAREAALKNGWDISQYGYPSVERRGQQWRVRFVSRARRKGDHFVVVINTLSQSTQILTGE